MRIPSLTRALWLALRLLLVLAGCWYVSSHLTWGDVLIVRSDEHPTVDSRLASGGSFPCERIAGGQARVSLPSGEPVTVSLAAGANAGLHLRPGLRSTFIESNWWWLGVAILISISVFFFQASRWRRLLSMRGIDLSSVAVLRMTLIGSFCNYFMLGSTGGDVVKACYAVRTAPQKKIIAVSTVIADRVLGLVSLVAICVFCVASPTIQASPRIAWTVAGSILATAAGCLGVLAWSRLRRLGPLRTSVLMAPFRALLDHAVPFLGSPRALVACLVLSVVSHLVVIAVFACCAQAVGIAGHWLVLAAAIPVIVFAGSLPISYLGFGVMEPVAMTLLVDPGIADANQIVMLFLLGRVPFFLWSLPGAAFMVAGQEIVAVDATAAHPAPAEDERAATAPTGPVNP